MSAGSKANKYTMTIIVADVKSRKAIQWRLQEVEDLMTNEKARFEQMIRQALVEAVKERTGKQADFYVSIDPPEPLPLTSYLKRLEESRRRLEKQRWKKS
jgi:hypothetical protein